MTADALIVGAGPAGAWAAYRLARAGVRVTIFDPSHPREKPCGGGVTGRALGLVADVLPRFPRTVVVTRARFDRLGCLTGDEPDGCGSEIPVLVAGPGRARIGVEVPLPAHGLSTATGLVVASRREFDAALLDAAVEAGASLVRERAREVSASVAGVEVQTAGGRHQGTWLLGADGAGSLVRRRVARPFRRAQLSIAAGVFAHGATTTMIDLACLAEPPGYLWSFPRPDHLAVGIGCPADRGVTAHALQTASRRWLERAGMAPAARLESYGWPIPSLTAADLARERPAGPRWMLLGDAAGLVDPLTREGIYFALLSGAWAAEALVKDPGRAASTYAARLREEIHPELSRAARLRDGFFRADFLGLLLQALAESPRIAAVMADLIAGRQPYRGLRRRLLATGEWRHAGRLAALATRDLLRADRARGARRGARRLDTPLTQT